VRHIAAAVRRSHRNHSAARHSDLPRGALSGARFVSTNVHNSRNSSIVHTNSHHHHIAKRVGSASRLLLARCRREGVDVMSKSAFARWIGSPVIACSLSQGRSGCDAKVGLCALDRPPSMSGYSQAHAAGARSAHIRRRRRTLGAHQAHSRRKRRTLGAH
jgi:hypothetical protein